MQLKSRKKRKPLSKAGLSKIMKLSGESEKTLKAFSNIDTSTKFKKSALQVFSNIGKTKT